MKTFYKHCIRVTFIFVLGHLLVSIGVAAESLSHNMATAICDNVVKIVNSGNTKSHVIEFRSPTDEEENLFEKLDKNFQVDSALNIDYNHDGNIKTIAIISGGGTCRNHAIIDLGYAIKSGRFNAGFAGYFDKDQMDDELGGAAWGGRDFFLFVSGEPVVLTTDLDRWMTTKIVAVSWFGQGEKKVICVLNPTGNPKVHQVSAKDRGLCNAVINGKVSHRDYGWEKGEWVSSDVIKSEKPYREKADSVKGIRIDINADGKKEFLGLAEYASGAGCGSYQQWLVELSSNGEGIIDSPLNDIFQEHPIIGPINYTADSGEWKKFRDVRIFKYNNRPYVLTGSSKVISLWNNIIEEWCELKVIPQFKILRYY